MAKNCGDWGRDKAKERYAEGGAIKYGPGNRGAEAYDKFSLGDYPRKTDKPRVGPFPIDSGERARSRMPSASPQDSYKRPDEGYARGGAAFEGSKKDVAEDKKLARASGMSMKTWEKSAMDKAHDRKRGK